MRAKAFTLIVVGLLCLFGGLVYGAPTNPSCLQLDRPVMGLASGAFNLDGGFPPLPPPTPPPK